MMQQTSTTACVKNNRKRPFKIQVPNRVIQHCTEFLQDENSSNIQLDEAVFIATMLLMSDEIDKDGSRIFHQALFGLNNFGEVKKFLIETGFIEQGPLNRSYIVVVEGFEECTMYEFAHQLHLTYKYIAGKNKFMSIQLLPKTRQWTKNLQWNVILPTPMYENLSYGLENNPPAFEYRKDVFLYFLNHIYYLSTLKKDVINFRSWIGIGANWYKNVVYNYKDYLNYLVEIDLIEINHHYSNYPGNVFTKGYRLRADAFYGFEYTIVEFEDHKLIWKIKEEKLLQIPKILKKWLNPNLTIGDDVLEAIDFEIEKFNSPKSHDTLMNKVKNYMLSYHKLKNHQFFGTRDKETDNRVHTNLTNMPRIFRPYIKYSGETLVSLDIKNSQPFLSALFIDLFILKNESVLDIDNYKEDNIKKGLNKNYIYDKIKNSLLEDEKKTLNIDKDNEAYSQDDDIRYKLINKRDDISTYICNMFLKLAESPMDSEMWEGLRVEVGAFLEVAKKGKFYEYILPKFESKFKEHYNARIGKYVIKLFDPTNGFYRDFEFGTPRDAIKKLTMYFLYKSNKNDNEFYALFKSHYPYFCQFIELMKGEDHTDFPRLLQHMEASAIIDQACKKIAKEHPTIPLWTIHDCIITTETHLDIVKPLVERYLTAFFCNVSPQLDVEYWGE